MDESSVQEEQLAYAGGVGQTRKRVVHLTCTCGDLVGMQVCDAVNVATDPSLADELRRGTLGVATCPRCGELVRSSTPVVYHDPAARLFAVVIPESHRHDELEIRIQLLRQLAMDPAHVPDYVKRAEAVVGTVGLERLRAGDLDGNRLRQSALDARAHALDRREEELHSRREDLTSQQEDLVAQQTRLEEQRHELAQARAELDQEREALRALSVDLGARERTRGARVPTGLEQAVAVEPPQALELAGRPKAEVDRWRTGDAAGGHFLHEGRVYLAARPGSLLPQFLEEPPALLLQLHRFPMGPFAAIVAVSAKAPAEDPAGSALFWPLDLGDPADVQILELLGARFAVQMDLFDEESRPVATWALEASLAENAQEVLSRGRRALEERSTDSPYDFAATASHYAALGGERLGRKQHNFSNDSFVDLLSPGSVRLALGILAYWSEPENEEYLLFVKSFPVATWKAIRQRVVRGALDFGLRLSEPLVQTAVELGLAPSPAELLRTSVSSFAEVSLRLKPCDLDPVQEWENWRLLLADCVQLAVQLEPEMEKLAAAAERRARESGAGVPDEAAHGGDLGLLADEALVPLLADRAQRRDAALELCARGRVEVAETVFGAVRNMTRAEVARVIPAMVQLGPTVAPLFLEGLKHRKSFVRQGCALALGTMKLPEAADSLVSLLLSEPTRVWVEAARALGDLGSTGLEAARKGMTDADPEGRERLAWALAQSAMTEEGRAAVEALAASEDAAASKVAARALLVLEQVRQADAEVRGRKPLSDQTIVRGFTRSFFESVAGEFAELSEADIVDQEEVLGDSDILDEEVEVADEDILEPAAPP